MGVRKELHLTGNLGDGMQIEVDFGKCAGHGVCALEAPEIFDIDDESGLAVLRTERPEGQEAAVNAAVRGCPERAITIA
ncbi:ferredoxin [Actinomadura opuntiae]|uniref:ferredoxin n=1 Tax=Actinomadura sp. OS1-43 TaxID=604315 RepID=UPI00255A86F4|nr:ferredoxin [Actinomadura sp. OS1-43]MDL4814238.1 ferredoxin [Actinomadura sp. OS1-43]